MWRNLTDKTVIIVSLIKVAERNFETLTILLQKWNKAAEKAKAKYQEELEEYNRKREAGEIASE